eukprot:COSAG01_NODE_7071_length_3367_cov_5.939718_2_plen_360_part_00
MAANSGGTWRPRARAKEREREAAGCWTAPVVVFVIVGTVATTVRGAGQGQGYDAPSSLLHRPLLGGLAQQRRQCLLPRAELQHLRGDVHHAVASRPPRPTPRTTACQKPRTGNRLRCDTPLPLGAGRQAGAHRGGRARGEGLRPEAAGEAPEPHLRAVPEQHPGEAAHGRRRQCTHARQRTRPPRVSCGWLPAISQSSAEAHKHVVGGGGAGVVARGGVVSHVRPDLSSASTMTTERAARALSAAKSKLVSAPAASEAEIAKQSLRAPHHRDQWQHAPLAALVSAMPRARGARAPEGGARAYHGATRGARVLLARMLHPPPVTFSRPRGTRATNSSQRWRRTQPETAAAYRSRVGEAGP